MNISIAILGPTASGKTGLAVELATALNGEIICMDSTTVYKGFDIGSAKPSAGDRAKVPHHGLDLLEPDEPFSAFHFVQYSDEVIEQIRARGKLPIVVGGSYFYMRALQHGMYAAPVIQAEVIESIEREFFEDENLNTGRMHAELASRDPKSAENIHPNDRYRLVRALAVLRTTKDLPSQLKPQPTSEAQKNRIWMKYATCLSRNVLNQHIVRRTERMLAQGLIDETAKLKEKHPQASALNIIGYAEACGFLNRTLTEKQLRNEIVEKTRQLAKRQTTWLRSDPEVRYIDTRDAARIQLEVENLRSAVGVS
jgi:tRNA dimethylallyltransferase